jgi:hypothetical protein
LAASEAPLSSSPATNPAKLSSVLNKAEPGAVTRFMVVSFGVAQVEKKPADNGSYSDVMGK